MADASKGPVSSMPGSRHPVPAGMMCDDHEDRPAVARIQGETDSWGCEYFDVCQECLDKHNAYINDPANSIGTCEWCNATGVQVKQTRDYDEGMAATPHAVCQSCRDKQTADLNDEIDYTPGGFE